MMRKTTLVIVGVVIMVALLAGGTLAAGRYMETRDDGGDFPRGTVKVLENVFDDGSGPITVRNVIEPSSQLPDRPADVSGVLSSRDGNHFFVGSGGIMVEVEVVNGEETVTTDHTGPELAVMVDNDTLLYRDVTEIDGTADESVERHIEQVIQQVDTLDGFPQNAEIEAWGVWQGDQLIADTFVFGELD